MSEEAAEKIDKVICELSDDIVGSMGYVCNDKSIAEKTQALASLVEASAYACRTNL